MVLCLRVFQPTMRVTKCDWGGWRSAEMLGLLSLFRSRRNGKMHDYGFMEVMVEL